MHVPSLDKTWVADRPSTNGNGSVVFVYDSPPLSDIDGCPEESSSLTAQNNSLLGWS